MPGATLTVENDHNKQRLRALALQLLVFASCHRHIIFPDGCRKIWISMNSHSNTLISSFVDTIDVPSSLSGLGKLLITRTLQRLEREDIDLQLTT